MESQRDALANDVNALAGVLDTIQTVLQRDERNQYQYPVRPSKVSSRIRSRQKQNSSVQDLPTWSTLSQGGPVRPTSSPRGNTFLTFRRLYVKPRDGRTSVSLATLRFGKGRRKRPTIPKKYKRRGGRPKNQHTRTNNLVPETTHTQHIVPHCGTSSYISERIACFGTPSCGVLSPRTLEIVRKTLRTANRRKRFRKYRDKYNYITSAKTKDQIPPKLNAHEKYAVLASIRDAESFMWKTQPDKVLSMEEVIANPIKDEGNNILAADDSNEHISENEQIETKDSRKENEDKNNESKEEEEDQEEEDEQEEDDDDEEEEEEYGGCWWVVGECACNLIEYDPYTMRWLVELIEEEPEDEEDENENENEEDKDVNEDNTTEDINKNIQNGIESSDSTPKRKWTERHELFFPGKEDWEAYVEIAEMVDQLREVALLRRAWKIYCDAQPKLERMYIPYIPKEGTIAIFSFSSISKNTQTNLF